MHVLRLPRLDALRAALVVLLAALLAVAAYAAGAELLPAREGPAITVAEPQSPASGLTPAPLLLPEAPPARR